MKKNIEVSPVLTNKLFLKLAKLLNTITTVFTVKTKSEWRFSNKLSPRITDYLETYNDKVLEINREYCLTGEKGEIIYGYEPHGEDKRQVYLYSKELAKERDMAIKTLSEETATIELGENIVLDYEKFTDEEKNGFEGLTVEQAELLSFIIKNIPIPQEIEY